MLSLSAWLCPLIFSCLVWRMIIQTNYQWWLIMNQHSFKVADYLRRARNQETQMVINDRALVIVWLLAIILGTCNGFVNGSWLALVTSGVATVLMLICAKHYMD